MNYGDTIEVFQYYPDKESVRFVRSILDQSVGNLNDLVMVDEDEFYVTNWKYFNNDFFRLLEVYLHLPITKVYHVIKGKVQTAASGLRGANGINKSRNGR